MSDAYLPGAAVLAHSLRDSGATKKLACLITQDTLRASTISELQSLYNHVIPIDRIGNPNPANLYLMNRPDLLYTFTKIHLWHLTQFRKVLYIDSDVVALRAPDELFNLHEDFAAAPDVGWPDAFNTGVMVLTPHMGDYWALRTLASAGDSFDGADQGLLNQYFEHKPWKRLSFTYNCTPSANYQYEPAYRYYKRDISMVHFIGGDKPWQRGRASQGAPNAYQELLSRWWAVYDRHFRVSTHEYAATGQREHQAVHQEVKEHPDRREEAYYATGYPIDSIQPAAPPEMPFTEPGEQGELIGQGIVEPTPTIEQRRFSAPHMEWDATRTAPPAESKPEAANFPTTIYQFNTDPAPFRPPHSYPEPPRDMWFEVPREKPRQEQGPPPIFPWEERRSIPTRKFIEDEPLPAAPPDPEEDFGGMDELAVSAEDKPLDPQTATSDVIEAAPWQSFGSANKNAWDDVGGINEYVHAFMKWQRTRGKSEDHTSTGQQQQQQQQVTSPPTRSTNADDLIHVVERKRRESLIVTDFPTASARPSLPVTPAPRRRSTFWGQKRGDDEGDLPGAEGVPDQADWDPSVQLEELRRNSLMDAVNLTLPVTTKKNLPARNMPATAAPIPEEVHGHAVPAVAVAAAAVSGGSSPHGLDQPFQSAARNARKPAPTFSEPVFDAPASSASRTEDVLSPSERVEGGGLS